MILLTNGDSWTQGDNPAQKINWEAQKTIPWYDIVPNFGDSNIEGEKETRIRYKFYESEVWPKTLGRHLQCETWNAGRLGADNYSIFRRTVNSVEWLQKQGKQNLFVVVGWSSMLRVPVFVYPKDDLKDMELGQARPGHSKILDRIVYNRPFIFEDMFSLIVMSLQNYLVNKNIPFLFFNAFDKYDNFNKSRYKDLIDTSRWIDHKLDKAHFMEYILKKHDLADWCEGEFFTTSHPRDNAHKDWGDYLFNYIVKNETNIT